MIYLSAILLLLTAFLVIRLFNLNNGMLSVAAAVVIILVLLVLIPQILSLFNMIDKLPYLSVQFIVLAIVAVVYYKIGRKEIHARSFTTEYSKGNCFSTFSCLSGLEKISIFLILAVICFYFFSQSLQYLAYRRLTFDAVIYHLPRVVHWIQNNNLDRYTTHNIRQTVFSWNYELVVLWFKLFGAHISYVFIINVTAFITAMLAGIEYCRQNGMNRVSACIPVAVAFCMPFILSTIFFEKNDMFFSSLLFISFCFLSAGIQQNEKNRLNYILLAIICFCLSIGTKIMGLSILPVYVLIIYFLIRNQKLVYRDLSVILIAFFISFLFIGPGITFIFNYIEYNSISGPEYLKTVATVTPEWTVFFTNFIRNGVGLFLLPGPEIIYELILPAIEKVLQSLGYVSAMQGELPGRFPGAYTGLLTAGEHFFESGLFGMGWVFIIPFAIFYIRDKQELNERSYVNLACIVCGVFFFIFMNMVIRWNDCIFRMLLPVSFFLLPVSFFLLPVYMYGYKYLKKYKIGRSVVLGFAIILTISIMKMISPIYFLKNSYLMTKMVFDESLSIGYPPLYQNFMDIEKRLPPNATIGVILSQGDPEYCLYDNEMTKKVISIEGFLDEDKNDFMNRLSMYDCDYFLIKLMGSQWFSNREYDVPRGFVTPQKSWDVSFLEDEDFNFTEWGIRRLGLYSFIDDKGNSYKYLLLQNNDV